MRYNNDIDGQPSSKRLWGGRMLKVGMLMGIILFLAGIVMAFLDKAFDYALPMELTWTFLGTGLGSLGLTLNERWGKQRLRGITPPDNDPPNRPPPEGDE